MHSDHRHAYMFVDLLAQLRTKGEVPSHLKVAVAAGTPCSPQLIKDMDKTMKAKVKALYGLTETTASVFQSVAGDAVDKVAETVGYIQDHVEVKASKRGRADGDLNYLVYLIYFSKHFICRHSRD